MCCLPAADVVRMFYEGKEAGGVEEHFRSSEISRKGYGSTGNHHTGADQSERLHNIPASTKPFYLSSVS